MAANWGCLIRREPTMILFTADLGLVEALPTTTGCTVHFHKLGLVEASPLSPKAYLESLLAGAPC